ncbi:MAG TPA: DUF1735 domain-containing protein [Chitinophagaceae bacterium]|nr:DUF1735 domain-containing protein [Chitinophagaceae bacterium]
MRSINKLVLFITILAIGASCIKEQDYNKGIVNNEKTIIKLPQAAEELWNIALDAVPGDQTVKVLEVRRDAVTNADLQQPLTVKIAPNNGAITAYNTANSTNLVPFTSYTLITDEGVKMEGANYVVPFNAGEFVKFIKIKFDPSKLDLSKRNAMAFKVTDGGGATISASQEALVEIAIKNKYDGVYRLEGTLVDAANSGIGPASPQDVELITTGAVTVKMIPIDLGIEGHLIISGGSLSYYGSYGPVFKFDENDNVIEVTNFYGQPAGNTRSAALDPTGVNKWNAATKKMTVKYVMKQPSVITAPPNIRVLFDETFTYLGPR